MEQDEHYEIIPPVPPPTEWTESGVREYGRLPAEFTVSMINPTDQDRTLTFRATESGVHLHAFSATSRIPEEVTTKLGDTSRTAALADAVAFLKRYELALRLVARFKEIYGREPDVDLAGNLVMKHELFERHSEIGRSLVHYLNKQGGRPPRTLDFFEEFTAVIFDAIDNGRNPFEAAFDAFPDRFPGRSRQSVSNIRVEANKLIPDGERKIPDLRPYSKLK